MTKQPSSGDHLNSVNIRDLSDFCEQWPKLKMLAEVEINAAENLSPETKKILHWLSLLADKVCLSEDF